MANEKDIQLNETAVKVEPEIISSADFNRLQQMVSTKVAKLTKQQAADALKAHNGDFKAASKALRADSFKARFAKYANNEDGGNTNWKQNSGFVQDAYTAVQDALSTLPDALILEQVVQADADDSVYAEFLRKTAGELEFINAGAGKSYIKEFFIQVITMDKDNLIPTGRRDVDNYSRTSSITLDDDIKQVYLSVSPWLYVKYFLSGKVDEYCLVAISNLVKSMLMKQYFDWIADLRKLFQTIYAKAGSTTSTPTNHIKGEKTGYLDCLQEYNSMVDRMQYHNTQFLNDSTCGVPYTSASKKNLVHIVSLDTYNTAKKYQSTFLSKEDLANYFANWIVVPEKAYNTTADETGAATGIATSNIFIDAEGKEVTGAILTIDSKEVHRIANLSISNVADFPFALTKFHNVFLRYAQKIMEWCSCSVYENTALNSDFTVPTSTVNSK